jgi:type 1 glutamine amidotransferase
MPNFGWQFGPVTKIISISVETMHIGSLGIRENFSNMRRIAIALLTVASILGGPAASWAAESRTALLLAGRPSHGPGDHEHNAGILLLAKCLKENVPGLNVITHLSGEWPSAEELEKADTIVFYADGGGGHPAIQGDRLKQVAAQMKRGAGLVCIHYAVEFPKEKGGPEFVDWLGGYFEPNWSVNPHWTADFKTLPKHAVTQGVKPFSTNDEWYYHMRFRDGMKGVTAILTDLPPADTLTRPDGPHSGNPHVRKAIAAKEPQHVAWATEREDGGRAFGFTGGHYHRGWGNDDQRKLVLNAILWTAKMDVPAAGVPSKVTAEELAQNLDPKPGPKPASARAKSKAE